MGIQIERFGSTDTQPLVSIVVLNYNTAGWLPKCFASIRGQTIFDKIELIFVDNLSVDDSMAVARQLLAGFPDSALVQAGKNWGFCEGNNIGARAARGRYLFFLNPDTWLEPDCMGWLLAEIQKAGVAAATPWVQNYTDTTHQDLGFFGFDIFGLASPSSPAPDTRKVFIAAGCAYLIQAETFAQIGMFDPVFFMYSDEVDLSWRVWISGHEIIGVPRARMHHRGAANVNPSGGNAVVEFRTTDQKRFYTNRNYLLTLLKNGRHIIVLLVVPLTLLLLLETLLGCLILKRFSFFKMTFVAALRDCWQLRGHIRQQRKNIAAFRRRSDFWMLRFFRLPLNRWWEIKRLFQFGLPRVNAK